MEGIALESDQSIVGDDSSGSSQRSTDTGASGSSSGSSNFFVPEGISDEDLPDEDSVISEPSGRPDAPKKIKTPKKILEKEDPAAAPAAASQPKPGGGEQMPPRKKTAKTRGTKAKKKTTVAKTKSRSKKGLVVNLALSDPQLQCIATKLKSKITSTKKKRAPAKKKATKTTTKKRKAPTKKKTV